MKKTLSGFVLPIALLAVIGCAMGGAGGAMYKEQLGMATPNDLPRKTRMIFERFQFEMEREDSSITYQTYRTRWKGRHPFQDELDTSVVEAMTRLIVTGRARGGGSAGMANVRVVEFTAENMVRYAEGGDWFMDLMTPMFREYVDEMSNALKMEFGQGIRVY